jgi:hypothetical protein
MLFSGAEGVVDPGLRIGFVDRDKVDNELTSLPSPDSFGEPASQRVIFL